MSQYITYELLSGIEVKQSKRWLFGTAAKKFPSHISIVSRVSLYEDLENAFYFDNKLVTHGTMHDAKRLLEEVARVHGYNSMVDCSETFREIEYYIIEKEA